MVLIPASTSVRSKCIPFSPVFYVSHPDYIIWMLDEYAWLPHTFINTDIWFSRRVVMVASPIRSGNRKRHQVRIVGESLSSFPNPETAAKPAPSDQVNPCACFLLRLELKSELLQEGCLMFLPLFTLRIPICILMVQRPILSLSNGVKPALRG